MKKFVVVCNDVNHAKLMVVDRKIRYEIIGNIQIIQDFESLLEVGKISKSKSKWTHSKVKSPYTTFFGRSSWSTQHRKL